jgi:hypothetical protein
VIFIDFSPDELVRIISQSADRISSESPARPRNERDLLIGAFFWMTPISEKGGGMSRKK